MRRYSPVISSASKPKRIDTADIDVSTPRNLSRTDNGRKGLRRDRPTIRIRSQALKDNPALRELNEKHEKTVGELLVEKFLIRDKTGIDQVKLVKPQHKPNFERTGNEGTHKITRRLTRRRSSLEVPTDSEIIAREVIIAQAQTEALDTLLEQEQAQIKVEGRRRTLVRRSKSRDSISAAGETSENQSLDEDEQPETLRKTPKKIKKKKKVLNKASSQPDDDDEEIKDRQTKSDSNLILQGQLSRDDDKEGTLTRPHTFKIEASNSVGDFSTLWINASSAPNSPIATEQYRESIRLPAPRSNKVTTTLDSVIRDDQSASEDDIVVLALPKKYVRDSTRNSVCLTLKTTDQQSTMLRTIKIGSADKISPIETLINSRHSIKPFNNNSINETENMKNEIDLEIENASVLDNSKKINDEKTVTKDVDVQPKTPINNKSAMKNLKNSSNLIKEENKDVGVKPKTPIKSLDNITKLLKKPIKKSDLEPKVKKAFNDLSVSSAASESSPTPTEKENSSPVNVVTESVSDRPEPKKLLYLKLLQDIVKVDVNSEAQKITENSSPQPKRSELQESSTTIPEVDFWGEIEPEITPIRSKSKLPMKRENSIIAEEKLPVTMEEEKTEDKREKRPLVTLTKEETKLEVENTPEINDVETSEEEEKGVQVLPTGSSTILESSLSIPSDGEDLETNTSQEDNVCAKAEDNAEELEGGEGSEVFASSVDGSPTPTPEVEERGTYSAMDSRLPTINIVAAPVMPEGNGADTPPDDEPGTPTNEWLNTSISGTMSRWESQNDLCDTNEADKEATPTPPSGSEHGVSPQSSKKRRLVKKKKTPSVKKEDSEDNEQESVIIKTTIKVPERSPKASAENSPKSSPRNSPKQRPMDLIRMFYTTPGPLLTATPRDLSKVKRGGRRKKQRNLSATSSASDSTESTRSTQSTSTEETSSTNTEGGDESKDDKRLTSTRSNDSGFDGSPRLTSICLFIHLLLCFVYEFRCFVYSM